MPQKNILKFCWHKYGCNWERESWTYFSENYFFMVGTVGRLVAPEKRHLQGHGTLTVLNTEKDGVKEILETLSRERVDP